MSNPQAVFVIKVGDRLPPLDVVLRDGDGVVVDPTSLAPTLRLRLANSAGAAEPLIDDAVMTVVDLEDETGATVKAARYAWEAGDTDTAGDYEAEVRIDNGGLYQTFPAGRELRVIIRERA